MRKSRTIYLQERQVQLLEQEHKLTGAPRSELVRRAIEAYIREIDKERAILNNAEKEQADGERAV